VTGDVVVAAPLKGPRATGHGDTETLSYLAVSAPPAHFVTIWAHPYCGSRSRV